MGRNPFYAENVRPLAKKPGIYALESIYDQLFQTGIVTQDDHVCHSSLPPALRGLLLLRFLKCTREPRPCLERACSCYRMLEEYMPGEEHTYTVVSVLRYTFSNRHSAGMPFEMHVLELANTDDRYYPTFCITTDGAVLNIESLSVRGHILEMEVLTPQRHSE